MISSWAAASARGVLGRAHRSSLYARVPAVGHIAAERRAHVRIDGTGISDCSAWRRLHTSARLAAPLLRPTRSLLGAASRTRDLIPSASHRTLRLPETVIRVRPYCSFHAALDPGYTTMSSTANPNNVDYRLPTNVKPTHYDLTVRTDLPAARFDGVVKISLDVKEETSSIVLNTKELKLSGVSLSWGSPRAEVAPKDIAFDVAMERGILTFPGKLPKGAKAELRIAFEGELTGAMMGYYKSIGGADGKEVYALTQFEPTAARKAFPCWDEPLLKATFAVTLISRADTVALSNMSAKSETVYEPGTKDEDGTVAWLAEKLAALTITEKDAQADTWKITKFETSPPMSTYLVAYANGRFKYLEDSYTSPLSGKTRPLRVYATEEIIGKAAFGLEVKKKVLPLYEKVFDIEYPLPKLDTLVAHDYDAGAMENWGLITGRTTAYLLDPKSGDLQTKKAIASTQCHEVAHMWFGDITTMAWWDNLYLNEGFATLMGEVIILDKIFPEWKLHSAFISNHLVYAMGVDAKLSSHPIEVECPDANMVNQIFDGLSYSKAASVLRMLSTYVGEERFLKGVSIYLKKHLFANSVTTDLWEGIQTATGLDIPKMMDAWVKKMGYPVITVKELDGGIQICQDRFLETGPAEAKDNETLWTIPLSLLTVSKTGEVTVSKDAVLNEREKFIPLDVSQPFKLNAGTVSFCRVLYSPERLVKIGQEAVQTPSPLSIEDRMGLVDDALALAKAGFSKVSSALSLIDVFRNEQEYLVWSSIAANLTLLRTVWWEHEDIVENVQKLRRTLLGPIVERLGYVYSESDSADTRELRTLAISQAAGAQHPNVVKELRERFAHYMKTGDDSNIPSELERQVYSTAVYHGGRAEWDAVKAVLKKPKNPTTAVAAMLAMGNTQDLQLAQETFDYMMKEARDQDVMYFFVGLSRNDKTRRFLAKAFKDNYDALYKRLEGNFSLQNLIKFSFRTLSTDRDYEETAEFFKGKDTSKYDMALKQTLEDIASKASWIKRSTTDIQQWFKKKNGGASL